MGTKRTKSEIETLENYRVALSNVVNQAEIASIMAEYAYDAAEIKKGTSLLTQARTAYDANTIEHDEASEVYAAFSSTRDQLEDLYSSHRKKAKIVFRNDAVVAHQLGIMGGVPRAYLKWLEHVKKFYAVVSTNTAIQAKLKRLKVPKNEINKTTTLITSLEEARSSYLKERGESQNATTTKDTFFSEIEDWMSEFFAIAKIALEGSPQLLETLGVRVK